jgi:hypothetical protein
LRVQERRLCRRHTEHAAIEGVHVCGSVGKLSAETQSAAKQMYARKTLYEVFRCTLLSHVVDGTCAVKKAAC